MKDGTSLSIVLLSVEAAHLFIARCELLSLPR